jgi:hypothetical protein
MKDSTLGIERGRSTAAPARGSAGRWSKVVAAAAGVGLFGAAAVTSIAAVAGRPSEMWVQAVAAAVAALAAAIVLARKRA